ncbi:MAG: nucleotidyltransferase domain-containing protein [Elusimicrobia bacterium]|nr:nucleotidyltransferase domain-containing protein [Elusimicrobiota bacterium]
MEIAKTAQQAINEFQRLLIAKEKDKITAIILYGSIIHRRYHSINSDIDILITAREKSIDEDVLELETAVSLKYGVVISALVTTENELRKAHLDGYQFPKEILKGRVIYERIKGRVKAGFRNA